MIGTSNLRSLATVRLRCNEVLEAAVAGNLHNFRVDLDKLDDVTEFIVSLIVRDYGSCSREQIEETIKKIPSHGRLRHFGQANVDKLLSKLEGDKAKAILDLVMVAVLLDAGAGDKWTYCDHQDQDKIYSRSEGLGVAALRMFEQGLFSQESTNALRVDAEKLLQLTEDDLIKGMQISSSNPMVGLAGRTRLLNQLGKVLQSGSKYFPGTEKRPSNLLNYLLECEESNVVDLQHLVDVIIEGLNDIWPKSRTAINGKFLGDVWPLSSLGGIHVPFHKLSQWLIYSLLEPLEGLAGLKFTNKELLTGLAEYRNGGLFIDMGVIVPLTLTSGQKYSVSDCVIVEWRAMTVALIDLLSVKMRKRLGVSAEQLPLGKLLEAGTWKAGREVAKSKRPSGEPPIQIESDGTLF